MANERDMVLAPNEYIYVSDETKGNIDIFVGPAKSSLSGTDQPVVFDEKTKRYRRTEFKEAIQTHKIAPEGWYVVLKNPAKGDKVPQNSGKLSVPELDIGRKINIPGPVAFALWPGQMAKVLKGHHLRSNQYLLVRVYDEGAARENWQKAVIKVTEGKEAEKVTEGKAAEKVIDASSLSMGQLLVIKGTQVSFYIPSTGVEVVPDEKKNLVRDAVTLERLEYCLLMDENGKKRYEQGPAVVFPEPTEAFIERDSNGTKTRKFRAIELNENSGIYIKVIAEYGDGNGENARQYKVGDELFITGKEQMIYFPREEHAVVKYDKNEIHYGVAIPAGEARYVLDRNRGNIGLVKGPEIFLPDPRRQVIVRRILDYKTCNLLYPNNQAAFEANAKLAGIDVQTYMQDTTSVAAGASAAMVAAVAAPPGIRRGLSGSPMLFGSAGASTNYLGDIGNIGDSLEDHGLGAVTADGFSGAAFDRKNSYNEPRTITLPTKFDGAVCVDIWTGYAVLLVKKDGTRRVVQGPQTVMLEYDESPQILSLSTGKPKNTDNLLNTVFLRTTANKVADIIEVETADFCKLNIKVSYRLNFEGEPEKWFDVENYVKFLCDNMRSNLRNAILKYGLEEFYGNHTEILRTIILGQAGENDKRSGTLFQENGMRVYDVEILKIDILHEEMQKMIVSAQREVIQNTLAIKAQRRRLEFTHESERIKQEEEKIKAETVRKSLEIRVAETEQKLALDMTIIASNATTESEKITNQLQTERQKSGIEEVIRDRKVSDRQADIDLEVKKAAIRLEELKAEAQAIIDKAKAISPDLIAALSTFGDRAMVEKIATAMAPLSLLGGGSVSEVLARCLQGTSLAKQLLPNGNGNGSGSISAHK